MEHAAGTRPTTHSLHSQWRFPLGMAHLQAGKRVRRALMLIMTAAPTLMMQAVQDFCHRVSQARLVNRVRLTWLSGGGGGEGTTALVPTTYSVYTHVGLSSTRSSV